MTVEGKRSRRQIIRWCGVALFTCLIGTGHAAMADVIEIAQDGSVSVFRTPAIYSSEGVQPIQAPRIMPRASAPSDVSRAIAHAAEQHTVSANLIEAVAWQESRLRQTAVSSKGAVGVMQLMDGTARDLGVDRYDLQQNIRGGASYLSKMLARYDGNIAYALAAYNAGPGAVDRYGGVPPFAETQAYVAAILGRLADLIQTPASAVTISGH